MICVRFLTDWTDETNGMSHPAGSQYGLDDSIAKGLIDTGTAEWVGMTTDPACSDLIQTSSD
jgi:hypothetical protein